MHKEHKTQDKKVSLTVLVISSSLVLLAALLALVFYTYSSEIDGRNNSGLGKMRMFFLPAMIIDGKSQISFSEVWKNMSAMRKFYETQDYSQVGMRVDFSTDDGKKRLMIKERELLNKMVEDRFVEVLAKENGISLAKADIDSSVQAKMDEYGSKDDVVRDLEAHYGWNIEDFKNEIVAPALYREQLAKKIDELSSEENAKFKQKIEKAQQELKNGIDFAQVAQKYSDGSTAQNGGELGWVSASQLEPALASAIFESKSSERFEIIESSLGYHIVDVEEKKKDNNEDVTRIRQVFVKKKTFASWLDEQIKTRGANIMLKGFSWDKNAGEVVFSSNDLKLFEKDAMEKAQGDASLLF